MWLSPCMPCELPAVWVVIGMISCERKKEGSTEWCVIVTLWVGASERTDVLSILGATSVLLVLYMRTWIVVCKFYTFVHWRLCALPYVRYRIIMLYIHDPGRVNLWARARPPAHHSLILFLVICMCTSAGYSASAQSACEFLCVNANVSIME
jgi:hypothetical protein